MNNRQSTATVEQTPKEAILEGAERVFRQYGYAKTTVADIARELGMSPANIYRFFPSKAAIHSALADRVVGHAEIEALQVARLQLPAAERLRLFVVGRYKSTVAVMLQDRKVHDMVMVALEQQWDVVERHLDRMTGIVEMIIKDGMASGEFARGDSDLAARCFSAATVAVCHPQIVAQNLDKPGCPTPEEIADFAVQALITGDQRP
ncbi:MAG TPA: TetR family transcriptional regulator [Devosia sp.]|jgi:AcrR family transcriptional regulator|nr:TetR family transcriptional regulator [Devosia sp.]